MPASSAAEVVASIPLELEDGLDALKRDAGAIGIGIRATLGKPFPATSRRLGIDMWTRQPLTFRLASVRSTALQANGEYRIYYTVVVMGGHHVPFADFGTATVP